MELFNFAVVLAQILLIDLVLAGDNAIVIGLAVARLEAAQRRKAIVAGIGGATVIRVVFALVALKLLAIVGLTLAGGILLLWVVWKSARELRAQGHGEASGAGPASLAGAIWKIIVADVSMSLDNVLAVAGAAHNNPLPLAIGLLFSVALMGVAASLVARLMQRFPWMAWVGIAIVFYVALHMIWEGWHQVAAVVK